MSIPTSWTLSDLTALEQAIKSGVNSVRYADRSVDYRSLDEMMELRRVMQRALGLLHDQTHYAEFKKGPRPGQLPGAGRHRSL